jgi:Uma2 family endonuclease
MNMPAGATLVSVEEYLRTDYKPACDYIDGVLRQKSMATYKHGKVQARLIALIDALRDFDAIAELTCWIREGKYLVPDVTVQRVTDIQDPYPTRPVHLCIEILSPQDRFSDTVAKCGEYHEWGVRYCWIVDPEEKRCWEYHAGSRPALIPPDGRIAAGPIILSHADIFPPVPA